MSKLYCYSVFLVFLHAHQHLDALGVVCKTSAYDLRSPFVQQKKNGVERGVCPHHPLCNLRHFFGSAETTVFLGKIQEDCPALEYLMLTFMFTIWTKPLKNSSVVVGTSISPSFRQGNCPKGCGFLSRGAIWNGVLIS